MLALRGAKCPDSTDFHLRVRHQPVTEEYPSTDLSGNIFAKFSAKKSVTHSDLPARFATDCTKGAHCPELHGCSAHIRQCRRSGVAAEPGRLVPQEHSQAALRGRSCRDAPTRCHWPAGHSSTTRSHAGPITDCDPSEDRRVGKGTAGSRRRDRACDGQVAPGKYDASLGTQPPKNACTKIREGEEELWLKQRKTSTRPKA